MIKSITIENFKSIKKLEIELAPLTIFVGPNGSGKSSILEAIALMSQATQRETSLTEGRKGHLVNFEERKNLFCKENEDSLYTTKTLFHTFTMNNIGMLDFYAFKKRS